MNIRISEANFNTRTFGIIRLLNFRIMYKMLFSFLLFFTAVNFFAQDFIDFETFDQTDAVAPKGSSVLIIPFSSNMYNNQESKFIVEKSGLEYEQTINYFKSSLDSSIFNALDDSCKVVSMLTGFIAGTTSDLEKLHGNAHYYLADIKLLNSKEKDAMFMKNDPNSNNVTERNKYIQNGEVVSVKTSSKNQYIAVKFDDQALVNAIAMKYGAKYLLFVNQFDILGDFSDPYKVAEKTYNRVIKVHYSLFTNTGTFLEGNVVEYTFPAYEDNIIAICNTNLPQIAKIIAKQIPKL